MRLYGNQIEHGLLVAIHNNNAYGKGYDILKNIKVGSSESTLSVSAKAAGTSGFVITGSCMAISEIKVTFLRMI